MAKKPSKRETNEEIRTKGIREGWLVPAKDPKGPLPRCPIPGLTLEQLMRELDEDRADRWPIPEENWTPAFRALIERTGGKAARGIAAAPAFDAAPL